MVLFFVLSPDAAVLRFVCCLQQQLSSTVARAAIHRMPAAGLVTFFAIR
jgi:hypothetical protein